jgi:hypothetical protein
MTTAMTQRERLVLQRVLPVRMTGRRREGLKFVRPTRLARSN